MPTEPTILQAEYTVVASRVMVSAQGERAKITLWDYAVEADGTYWLWPAAGTDEPGAMVHCGDDVRAGRPRSEGYGGACLTFPTRDGPVVLQGPWHSNTDALFERTGVDLRDKHKTWGVIGLNRRHDRAYNTVVVGVVHLDPPGGVVGRYDRIKTLAQQLADQFDRPMMCHMRSAGGGSEGFETPTGWDQQRIKAFFQPPAVGATRGGL